MALGELTLVVEDDLEGASTALRGWLASAGPEVSWQTLSPEPSEGQGILDNIKVTLESVNALLEIYNRVREWISNRGKHAKAVTATAVIDLDGKTYEIVVTLNPRERGNGRTS